MSKNNRYESHITISVTNKDQISKTEKFCKDNNCKFLIIELEKGKYQTQAMTSCYHSGGNDADIITNVFKLARKLEKSDFEILRIKIEKDLSSDNLPNEQINLILNKNKPNKYFENHLKIKLSTVEELDRLINYCKNNDLHISKNSQDESLNRFVTLRVYQQNLNFAKETMKNVFDKLQQSKFIILKNIQEYVMFDSFFELDSGW